MTIRETLVELVNKLFIHTDNQNWEGLKNEVFEEKVFLDMSSMGGTAEELSAEEICSSWQTGFKGLDAVNHLAGNYLVDPISDYEAKVFAYATATHYKASATKGKTREFVGTYDLKIRKQLEGWRIYSFVYHLKYATGNMTLE